MYNSANITSIINKDGTLNCSGDGCPVCFNNGSCDGEPDMFYFSFGNVAGKFFFGEDGQPHIVSDRKLKISYVNINTSLRIKNGIFDNFYGFSITTEDGTIYRFGDPAKSIGDIDPNQPMQNVEFSFSQSEFFNPYMDNYITPVTAWMLREIEDVNGNKIYLTYQNDYRNSSGFFFQQNRQRITVLPYDYFHRRPGHTESSLTGLTYSVASENLLTKIESTNWKVDLYYKNTEPNELHTLDSISFWDNKGNEIKHFGLEYSSRDMLSVLTTLNERPNSASPMVRRHSFLYNSFPAGAINIRALDYWGYYNGANNTSLIPFAPYNANRAPLLDSTVMGALKKITYPTGGATTFEYEQNEFSFTRNYTTNTLRQPCGGIRLKKITDTDIAGNPPVVKTYSYDYFTSPSLSSGFISAPISNYYYNFYVSQPSNDFGGIFGPSVPDIQTNWEFWKSDPFYSLSLLPVYYANVRETIGNSLKTDFTFTSHLDYPDELGVNYGLGDNQVGSYGSFDFARSLPKNVKYYKKDTLVLEKQTDYTVSVNYRARTLWRQVAVSTPNVVFQFIKGLSTISGTALKTSETTKSYFPAEVVSTTSYEYDPNYHFQKKQAQINSDGKVTETSYKYPFDMQGSVYSGMVAKNIVSPVIETTVAVNNVQQLLSRTNYGIFNDSLYLPKTVESQVGNNEIFLKGILNDYDAKGKLLEEKIPGGISTSYQWGYGGQYPVAKVTNAHNYSTTVTGPGTGTKNIAIYLGPTGGNYPNPSTTTFVQATAGDIVLQFSAGAPYNATSTSFSFTLSGPSNKSGSFSCSNGTCNLPVGGAITYTNMPQGNYTLSLSGSTSFQSYTFQVGITCSYRAMLQNVITENQYFHENFEDGNGDSPAEDSKTGHFSKLSSYSKALTNLVNGSYILSYWAKTGGSWNFVKMNVSVTNNSYPINITGQSDDLRFYPADAQMTTYTYDPLVGMTSSTDAKNQTTYYVYDGFQRLITIKDQKGNILENYDYHYKP
ncbi:hypothetical protein BC343_15110 [Mucilaginibacter pedocola]|uniref:YD repeat-containing protein n=1 Tax=Mucilaginibacter pedocola TaxID=1792845 RepID=A0A1S9P8W8_9SPHI|nr:hypothetical protein BC343_15110 [Mucilaginibacter pedocola]